MAKQYGRVIRVEMPGTGLAPISEPRIDIDVQAQADDEQNWTQVSIYNLNESTYARIEDRRERLLLDAGYESAGGASRIFEGTIQRVWKDRMENAFITRIEASDSMRSHLNAGGYISQTFDGEVSARAIAVKLIEAMTVTGADVEAVQIGSLASIPQGAVVTDFRAEGQPADQMNRLLALIPGDVRWYIDLTGVARFDAGESTRTDAPSITKSPTTGLVSVPSLEEDGRMSVTMLLEPRVQLGSRLTIEDSDYVDSTPYKVVGIEHTGTNWRGRFHTILDCKSPEENS